MRIPLAAAASGVRLFGAARHSTQAFSLLRNLAEPARTLPRTTQKPYPESRIRNPDPDFWIRRAPACRTKSGRRTNRAKTLTIWRLGL